MTSHSRDLGAAQPLRRLLALLWVCLLAATANVTHAQDTDTASTPVSSDQLSGEVDDSAYKTQAELDAIAKEAADANPAVDEVGAAPNPDAAAPPEGAPVTGERTNETPPPAKSTFRAFQDDLDKLFEQANNKIAPILFVDISGGQIENKKVDKNTGQPVLDEDGNQVLEKTAIPLIVVVLLLGGVFFTFRFGFINVRLFAHSIQVLRGKYDHPNDHGEISHFQALTAALSATVGLGNIAGVAVAISQGGAGAVFWIWVVAFFGMCSKFSSCTLAQLYRRVTAEEGNREHILGGPMVYLDRGIREVLGKAVGLPLGKGLAILFAFFAICGALGGGNLFQGNQTFAIVGDVIFVEPVANEAQLQAAADSGDTAAAETLQQARIDAAERARDKRESYAWVGGLVMAGLVGIVIIGGIRRIGDVTSKLVPGMCVFYVGICALIILSNFSQVDDLLMDIVAGAFTAKAAGWGGIMGVLVVGVQRGAFSNEAGLGSAAIAHSAAKTAEPVREGAVAMIGPFIDTHVVCTMTALAILITGAHLKGSAGGFSNEGVGITASAFSSLHGWLPYMLTIAVFTFAYSTMISWSYYGERASEYLFGKWGIWPFRVVFLVFVFISPMLSLSNVIGFTDLLLLSMAYPNILGMLFLSGKVARATKDYVQRLKSGEIKTYAQLKEIEEGEPSI